MARTPPDKSATLDELEGVAWGPPTYDSYLVTTCHRLRTRPIGQFAVEDLRIMIGQGIGLPYLIPLALDVLERAPLAEGDYYPGDLLNAVLSVDASFWSREWEWAERAQSILHRLHEVPKELREAIATFEGRAAQR
jgi:hypothetical protein